MRNVIWTQQFQLDNTILTPKELQAPTWIYAAT